MEETLKAKDVNERLVKQLQRVKYVLLQDKSALLTFDNMIKAINVFAKEGWKCISITTHPYHEFLGPTNAMLALLENQHTLKEKLEPTRK